MRLLLRAILVLVGGLLLFAVVGLVWAHVAIRRERAALPATETIVALGRLADLPVRVAWINTASQPMPRSAVLEASEDPGPDAPYVMSHPAIVLAWDDQRLLLVDLGMTREGAVAFGRMSEWLLGAAPIQPRASVAEALGATTRQVRGIVITHLHDDHVGGLPALCAGVQPPVPVFMTAAQRERPNYTTRSGLRTVRETACARIEPLDGDGLLALPGFPGVGIVDAGGHTPGSQVVFAYVAGAGSPRGFAFVGDLTNHVEGIRRDVPKPWLYSLLMVPEDTTRLGELRRWLGDLETRFGLTPVPAHDQRWLEQSGITAW